MAAKKPKPTAGLHNFAGLVKDVKGRIQAAQSRSLLAVNAELVRLYWDIGRIINDRQQQEGWGAAVIPRLAATLRNELPDLRGFSERNIGLMISFARAYPQPDAILQLPVAKLAPASFAQPAAAQLPDSLFWSIS